jgi:hypothetical protein
VICGIIRGGRYVNLHSLQLTQNSKSDKKNGARNFDSATTFYDHEKNLIQHTGANVHLITCTVGVLAFGSDAQLLHYCTGLFMRGYF